MENNVYEKILELTDSPLVKLSDEIKNEINKELYFGMSDYVIEHGSLSEGHEKLTPAQRYYQAKREMYNLGSNIAMTKYTAMEAQADLMDAQMFYDQAKSEGMHASVILRAEAKLMMAKHKLTNLLVTIEDQTRQLKAFDKVRASLEHEVKSKYSCIEDAEHDNWSAVLKYRIMRSHVGHREMISHVPMPMEEKAKLGIKYKHPEAMLWLALDKEDEINKTCGGDIEKYLAAKESKIHLINGGKTQ